MVHVMHRHFMFFAVFKNLKSLFSEDIMQEHVLDIFIENATKMFWVIPLNAKNDGQTLRWHKNFAFSDTMQWGLMGGMHSGVNNTVFHSDDAWNSMP